MKKKALKGDFDYLPLQRKRSVIRTLIYLIFVLIILFTGIIITKTRNNLFTVIAVLGALPLGKSIVNLLMIFKVKPVNEDFHKEFAGIEDKITIMYNMMISSQEKVYFAECIAISGHSVYLYVTDDKTDDKTLEKYIRNILSNSGKGNVNIKLYRSKEEFTGRLAAAKDLQSAENAAEFEEKTAEILRTFCL